MSKRIDWKQDGLSGPPGSVIRRLFIGCLFFYGCAIVFGVFGDDRIWGLAVMVASTMFSNLDSIAADVRGIRERLDKAIGQKDKLESE